MSPRRLRRQPVTDGLTRRHSQTVGTSDADRRSSADPQHFDRFHQRVDVAAGDPLVPRGQERLVDEFEVAGVRMAGGLAMPAEGSGDHMELGTGANFAAKFAPVPYFFPSFVKCIGSQGRPKASATAR